jgi:hypothetical protein
MLSSSSTTRTRASGVVSSAIADAICLFART